MWTSTTTLTNPSLNPPKTCFFTQPINTPSIKPFFYKTPLKPTINLSLSLQKPPTIVSCVAQTSEWNPEGPSNVVVDQDEGLNWGSGPQVSSFNGESEGEGFNEVPSEEAKVFVGNLPYDVDSEGLANLFDGVGVVEIAEVIYNRETDRSRGFGFVTMRTVEEAEKAVEMLNGYELNGRLLTVNKAGQRGSRPERPPREFSPSCRVYVGNLSWDLDSARLEQVFSEFGKVLSARVVSDRDTGRSRGFGFVTMSSESEVNDAIAALDGQTLDGRAIRVNVAEERPRRAF